jgi:hypothetical protein
MQSPGRYLGFACALLLAACDSAADDPTAPEATASSAPLAAPKEIDETVVPKRQGVEPNPLGLPAASVTYSEGQFVYAVPNAMLATAKVGKSLELRAAHVETMDGHDVIVRTGTDSPYTIHPGYVVAPKFVHVERGARVFVPHRGRLRHGVVQRQVKNQLIVRYADVGVPPGDQTIALDEVGVLGGGLEPGGYAIARHAEGQHLVMLVSSGVHADGTTQWFVLGPEGEARLYDAKDLATIPDARKLKPGSSVLVAWHGDMVPATLRTIDPTGVVSVKRPHVGAAIVVGIDLVIPAPPTAEPTP